MHNITLTLRVTDARNKYNKTLYINCFSFKCIECSRLMKIRDIELEKLVNDHRVREVPEPVLPLRLPEKRKKIDNEPQSGFAVQLNLF